jgi:hypothetical protein
MVLLSFLDVIPSIPLHVLRFNVGCWLRIYFFELSLLLETETEHDLDFDFYEIEEAASDSWSSM